MPVEVSQIVYGNWGIVSIRSWAVESFAQVYDGFGIPTKAFNACLGLLHAHPCYLGKVETLP